MPPSWLAETSWPIDVVQAGTPLFRVHRCDHDPIFFGPGQGAAPTYRFDSPSGRFGVLYVGFSLGAAIVERLQPWRVRFQTYRPRQHGPLPDGVKRVELDALLQTSDIITLLTPLTPETRGMIDARRLNLVQQGAILVNAARGGIIDEDGLYDLAKAGRFRAIALDVFATEPLPPDSKLRDLENAILTPHMIGHTTEALQAFVETALENAVRMLDGRAQLYVRNKQILGEWERRFG